MAPLLQIHGKAATAIRTRFVKLFDAPIQIPDVVTKEFSWFPTPEMVLEKSMEELRSAGLSARKAEYIHGLARMCIDKSIDVATLDSMSDDDISKLLCSVKGIGQVG